MFEKAFRVKSNTVIKGSDRRKLRADIASAFPALSPEELAELVPNKEELNVVKVFAHRGDVVTLYVLRRNPLFFQVEGHVYPTVYTLWRFPGMLPAFVTWPAVLPKLAGGADLMLPGVVVPPRGLPEVQQGDVCAVTVVSNRAPVAVGTATMSNTEMKGLGMKGKGVSIIHTYMDHLWAFGDKSAPPSIPPVEDEGASAGEEEDEGREDEEETEGGEERGQAPDGEGVTETPWPGVQELSLSEKEEEEDDEDVEDTQTPQDQMDALLLQCFFHALKSKVKKSDLPLLTSTFLAVHMFSCCPRGKQLDIKKSSYKKLSRFLQQQHQLITVRELNKGVESIVQVDWKNPELHSFSTPEDAGIEEVKGEGEGERQYQPPEITSLFAVSARLEPLFQETNKKKGTVLTAMEVRAIVTDYVKNNHLVNDTNKNCVNINPVLCDCLLEKSEYQEVEYLMWDDLFSRTMDRMQLCHRLVFPGQAPVVRKGHLESINISVASRGSNKKVTLIKNLEVYRLDPSSVATALQHRVQASSVLHPVPGSKNRVLVQIQGNQIQQVGKLLLDHYQIPRKYIQGLEREKPSKPAGKKK